MANIPILSFNAGEMTPKIDPRSDLEKYRSGCRHLENMLPLIYGCAERRPGTYYIAESYNSTETIRKLPFMYSSTIAYTLEFGNEYIRVFYDGAVIETISSPYQTADLFQLQYKQIGDVMWIVHSSYAPRKLIRMTATTFLLEKIEFSGGPFLLRNDLIDVTENYPATMTCTATTVGETGTLTCEGDVFDDDHVGALFKLVHPRVNTTVSHAGEGASSALDVKGNFSFNTHGTWTGTARLQRRENSSSDNDWEDFRIYPGSNDRNIQYSGTENAFNVEYRIKADAGMSAGFSADITVNESTQTGIVKILSVTSATVASVQVLTEVASTNATKRWAEGAWSDYRTYPSAITFKDDRCIYAGSSVNLAGMTGSGGQTGQILPDYGSAKESCITGDTDKRTIYGLNWFGQTFTASSDYELRMVSLKFYRAGNPGTVTVSIRETGTVAYPDDPIGSDISVGTINGNGFAEEGLATFYDIDLTPIALTSGTTYAIIVRAPYGDASNAAYWKRDPTGTYAGGQEKSSTNSGQSWGTTPQSDFMFKTFGLS